MKYLRSFPKYVSVFLLASFFLTASPVSAAEFEVAGWIPYWAVATGTKDARRHLDLLTTIHPFVYSVQSDGELKDLGGISKSSWQRLFKEARGDDVLVIPTVMSSDGALIHSLLSNKNKREDHIEEIVELVLEEEFDGIDIDYEEKLAETKDHFSLFLKELKHELGDKLLTCTVEARTPPDSLYRNPPAVMQYANDYTQMGKHCDRIEIMAYDQQRADIKLNDARRGSPYMPVADIEWVKKVVTLAEKSIPKEKIILGIPTYGHEYQVTVSPNWYQSYTKVRSLNPGTAKSLARKEKVTPSRTGGGEMSFTYMSDTTAEEVEAYKAPAGTPKGNRAAAQALAYANATGKSTVVNMVVWSDAEAIEDKVDLAEQHGLGGVAIFKIDGQEDSDMWDVLEDLE
jgi:spore germination protein YaaH